MRAALVSAALLVAGCAVPQRDETSPAPVESPAPQAAARTQAEEIVAYIARLRGMSEPALAAEAARRRREATDMAHVKAALALSLSAQADEAEVIALVEPLANKDNGDRDVKAVASFLHSMMTERRRLKESAAAAGAKLREERRGAEAQKQRADALQQKLDALTDLEKNLSDRPSPNR